MDPREIDLIIRKAEEKHGLVKMFLSLTEAQAEAIDNDNYESLLNVISKKQNIVEKINILDLELQDHCLTNNDRVQAIFAGLKSDLVRAIELDNRNIQQIRKNQAVIIEKIKDNRTKKTTHALYRGKGAHLEGILLDRVK